MSRFGAFSLFYVTGALITMPFWFRENRGLKGIMDDGVSLAFAVFCAVIWPVWWVLLIVDWRERKASERG